MHFCCFFFGGGAGAVRGGGWVESLGEVEIDSNVGKVCRFLSGKVMNLLLGVLVEVVASVLTRFKNGHLHGSFSGDFFVGNQPTPKWVALGFFGIHGPNKKPNSET